MARPLECRSPVESSFPRWPAQIAISLPVSCLMYELWSRLYNAA
jgi:hypothetical protein